MISESQERMVAVVAPERLARCRGVCRELGARCAVDRRGHRHRRAALLLRRRGGRRDPRPAPHGRGAALPGRDRRRASSPSRSPTAPSRPPIARAARAARARRTSRSREPGLRALRPARRLAHRAPARPRRRGAPPAALLPRARRLARRGRPAAALDPRTGGACSPCSSRRATSPAPAGRRSRSPTASTSATRRSPRSPGSSPRRSRAWRSPARRSASRSSRATSRSTTRRTGARSTRRRWSAAWASSTTSARFPAAGARATSCSSPARRRFALDGSEYQARFLGGAAGRPPHARPRRRGGARRRSSARSAPLAVTRAHDASDGGLAVALAELALWSRASAPTSTSAGRRARLVRRGRRPARSSRAGRRTCARSTASRCAGTRRGRRRPTPRRPARRALAPRYEGGLRLMCGIFGIHAPERDVARLAYFGLFALQHRGQESAGIAVSDDGRAHGAARHGARRPGLLRGEAPGPSRRRPRSAHCRYSTTGSTHWTNAQPIVQHGPARTVALAPQRQPHEHDASCARSSIAAGVQARVHLRHRGDRRADRARRAAARGGGRRDDGAARGRLLDRRCSPRASWSASATRTGSGRSSLGRLEGDYVLASETCAFDLLGAELVREVSRASWSSSTSDGLRVDPGRSSRRAAARSASSSSSTSRGPTRRCAASSCTARACGWASGSREESPVEADVVMPIPDSGTPAAIGFARASGIPYNEGLIKNRYVGRTFIQPDQALREHGIRTKFNPLAEVAGQARRRRRRLDRPRHDHPQDRRDALRGGRRPRCTCASRRRRSSRPASTASTWRRRTS